MSKKFFIICAAFTAVLSAVIVMVVCARTKDWRYYDQFIKYHDELERPVSQEPLNIRTLPETNIRICRAFNSAKKALRDKFNMVSGLNWDRFEKTQLMEGVEFLHNGADAMYGVENNAIYVFRIIETKTDRAIEAVLAHELIHALTVVDDESHSILYEGLTEYMSKLLYTEEYVSYDFSVGFVQLYAEKFGLEKAIEVFPYDDCAEIVSELITDRNNVMHNIEDVIFLVCCMHDEESERIVLDVMAHLCKEINGDKNIVMNLAKKNLGNDSDALDYLERVLNKEVTQ